MTVLQFPDRFYRARVRTSPAWAAPGGPDALADVGNANPSLRRLPVGGLAHGAVSLEGRELAGPALEVPDPHAHADEDLGGMAVIAYGAGALFLVGVGGAFWAFGGLGHPVTQEAVGLSLFGVGVLALIRYLDRQQ